MEARWISRWLIVAVLGAISGGIASPNEAASVGAVGAILLAGYRRGAPQWIILSGALAFVALAIAAGVAPVRLQRSDAGALQYTLGAIYAALGLWGMIAVLFGLAALWRQKMIVPALAQTLSVTAMIFATILMASYFSLVFVGLGGEHRVMSIIESLPGGRRGVDLRHGVHLPDGLLPRLRRDIGDPAAAPHPPAHPDGHDPIWLAVLIAVNLQTSFLTPPFGFSLFYLRGAASKSVTTGMIYRGVIPFILLQAVAILIIWLVPSIATWLPRSLF